MCVLKDFITRMTLSLYGNKKVVFLLYRTIKIILPVVLFVI